MPIFKQPHDADADSTMTVFILDASLHMKLVILLIALDNLKWTGKPCLETSPYVREIYTLTSKWQYV
jgi:hypothetical protein